MDNQLNEKARISPRNVLGSPECMTSSGGPIAEFKSGIEGNKWDGHLIQAETKGFVNNNDTLKPNTRHDEVVNNRQEILNMEAQRMFVNSDREGLKVENHFEEGDEFD